ncbi:MAG: AAA family ATPase [Bernardetiaceae bacterium]|nr:AAA family ATPase [Bernardetiaceae bacterium]
MSRKKRIETLLKGLFEGIYEKEEALRLSLLTAIAGESVFLLGPPGVAKSLIARRLKYAFKDGKSFEYLMNKFSTPDEIFGPVSIKKLKDEDKFERLTDKYMPGATIVFLDEIWKAGPSIQNALLTIINEKIYRNGEQEIKVEIKGIIAASNELPPENEGLEALWDRFLIRNIIGEIQQSGNFVNLLTRTQDVYEDRIEQELKISNQELYEWEQQIDKVSLPPEVINTIQLVKHQLDSHDNESSQPFRIYDRRWKKIAHLIRTSAFLNDRKEADLMDCFLMVHMLWSQPNHIEKVQEIVAETIRKHGYNVALNLSGLRKEVQAIEQEVFAETKIPHQTTVEELYAVERQYYEVLSLESYLDGKYIKRSDLDKLQIEEQQTIGVYDEQFKLTYKVKAQRSKIPHHIEITHNAQTLPFKLRTHKTEKQDIIYKKPHPLLRKYWNEQYENLQNYIQTQLQKIDSDQPQAVAHLENNLFVEASLAKIVLSNLNDAINTLNELQLRLEKIKHYYEREFQE